MIKRSTGRITRNDEYRNTRRERENTSRENSLNSRLTAEPDVKSNVNSGNQIDTDSLIADMAKGFVAAQSKINASSNEDNGEMIELLTKISRQLENIQEAGSKNPQQVNSRNAGSFTGVQQGDMQRGGNQTQQQQALQSGNQGDATAAGGGMQQRGLMTQRQQSSPADSQASAGNQGGAEATGNNSAGGFITPQQQSSPADSQASAGNQGGAEAAGNNSAGGQFKAAPVQNAAQLLNQAQFELSQELEASLQKLKQVIADSENLAGRISTLIGKENNSQ